MPVDPVRLFLSLYCGSIALQTAIHYRDQLQFFRTDPARIYGPPPPLLGVFSLPPLNEPLFAGAGLGFVAALAAAAAGFAVRFSLAAAIICFLIYFPPILALGYIQRKANLIPIILAILLAQPAHALLLVKLAITSIYLLAGIEKLRSAGIRWVDGRSLQSYLLEHHFYSGRPQPLWLARHGGLCRVFSIVALLWELSFGLVIFFPASAWIYVPLGLLFHAGTSIAMRIHYWIYFCPAYFVFLTPWLSSRTFP